MSLFLNAEEACRRFRGICALRARRSSRRRSPSAGEFHQYRPCFHSSWHSFEVETRLKVVICRVERIDRPNPPGIGQIFTLTFTLAQISCIALSQQGGALHDRFSRQPGYSHDGARLVPPFCGVEGTEPTRWMAPLVLGVWTRSVSISDLLFRSG